MSINQAAISPTTSSTNKTTSAAVRRRAPKVGHRKSRNGCTVCRTRRVKCDEAHPFCGSCTRLGLDCAWPTNGTSRRLNGVSDGAGFPSRSDASRPSLGLELEDPSSPSPSVAASLAASPSSGEGRSFASPSAPGAASGASAASGPTPAPPERGSCASSCASSQQLHLHTASLSPSTTSISSSDLERPAVLANNIVIINFNANGGHGHGHGHGLGHGLGQPQPQAHDYAHARLGPQQYLHRPSPTFASQSVLEPPGPAGGGPTASIYNGSMFNSYNADPPPPTSKPEPCTLPQFSSIFGHVPNLARPDGTEAWKQHQQIQQIQQDQQSQQQNHCYHGQPPQDSQQPQHRRYQQHQQYQPQFGYNAPRQHYHNLQYQPQHGRHHPQQHPQPLLPFTATATTHLFPHVDDPLNDVVSIPETRQRRLLEHRLVHNYITHLNKVFAPAIIEPPSDGEWRNVWAHAMPDLILANDNLMHALMAMSATHLLRSGPPDADRLFAARQVYVIAATREQRRAVDAGLTPDTADPVCLAALVILVNTFAMLQERTLPAEGGMDAYEPPVEWLQLGKASGVIIWSCYQVIAAEEEIRRKAAEQKRNSNKKKNEATMHPEAVEDNKEDATKQRQHQHQQQSQEQKPHADNNNDPTATTIATAASLPSSPSSNPSLLKETRMPLPYSLTALIDAHPRLYPDDPNDSYFDPSLFAPFAQILSVPCSLDCPLSPSSSSGFTSSTSASSFSLPEEIRLAYEQTLSYIGSMQQAIDSSSPSSSSSSCSTSNPSTSITTTLLALARRVHGFALLVPQPFVTFLAEKRPRALVVLAHFFGVVVQLDHLPLWWLGGDEPERGREPTAKREIRAILKALSGVQNERMWRGLMGWPVRMAGLKSDIGCRLEEEAGGKEQSEEPGGREQLEQSEQPEEGNMKRVVTQRGEGNGGGKMAEGQEGDGQETGDGDVKMEGTE